jgi:hypothetical protein
MVTPPLEAVPTVIMAAVACAIPKFSWVAGVGFVTWLKTVIALVMSARF